MYCDVQLMYVDEILLLHKLNGNALIKLIVPDFVDHDFVDHWTYLDIRIFGIIPFHLTFVCMISAIPDLTPSNYQSIHP